MRSSAPRARGFAKRLSRIGLCLTAILLCGDAIAAGSLEYALKANYLYKFAPFMQWPDAAFPSADSPINVCVSGADPFGSVLDQAVAGQRVGGRPIVVKRIAAIAPDNGCHIAFIGGSSDQTVAQGLDAIRGEPVLSVTDSNQNSHGIVSFVIVDNHVRFEIDEHAAAQSHIAISSKLLSLARLQTN